MAIDSNTAISISEPAESLQAETSTPLTWREVLKSEIEAAYFKEVQSFVKRERAAGKVIYPPQDEVFNALKLTEFTKVKVIIIGQDPYHGPGQAHGLCFSVKAGVPPPPSLMNIFKEIKSDMGLPIPNHGSLENWTKQGVLLLNTVLTVEKSKPASHKGRGWEKFTDQVIITLSQRRTGLVFLLWGSHAQAKKQLIDLAKHTVLIAPHPSPFSAHNGFFGCQHFSKTNQILRSQGQTEIDWSL